MCFFHPDPNFRQNSFSRISDFPRKSSEIQSALPHHTNPPDGRDRRLENHTTDHTKSTTSSVGVGSSDFIFRGMLIFRGFPRNSEDPRKFEAAPPEVRKNGNWDPAVFFRRGGYPNLQELTERILGKHFVMLPRWHGQASFSQDSWEILGIPRKSCLRGHPRFPFIENQKQKQRNAETKQARPQLCFAPKIIKIHSVGLENELFEYNKLFQKSTKTLACEISYAWMCILY